MVEELDPWANDVRAVAAQDKAAFARLFFDFAPRVKAYFLVKGVGSEQAEELAQEVLVAVWRDARNFDPQRAAVSAWIFTIARNKWVDALRKERHASTYASEALGDVQAEANPEEQFCEEERRHLVGAAVERMPLAYRQIVHLSFFQDRPHSAIAHELNLPLGTVKSRLRLAVRNLRKVLGDLA